MAVRPGLLGALLLLIFAAAPLQAARNTLELGNLFEYFYYREDLLPPKKSAETGYLPGLHAAYTYLDHFYLRVSLDWLSGNSDYDGSTQDGIPITYRTNNDMTRLETAFGYTITGQHFDLTPYAGVGCHTWRRGLGGTLPYDEVYSWGYIPLGLRARLRLDDRLLLEAHLAIHLMYRGHLAIDSAWLDAEDTPLEARDGHRLEFPLNYTLTDRLVLVFVPYYLYSAFGQSSYFILHYADGSRALAFEPASDTRHIGLQLRFAYTF